MNEYERLRRQAIVLRDMYPPGTRVECLYMSDPFAPVPSGTRGTVFHVDDMAQIHVNWDNGSSLALNRGEDSFRKNVCSGSRSRKQPCRESGRGS